MAWHGVVGQRLAIIFIVLGFSGKGGGKKGGREEWREIDPYDYMTK